MLPVMKTGVVSLFLLLATGGAATAQDGAGFMGKWTLNREASEDLSAKIKLAAGSLVLYPSTYLHRVETVRTGRRLVAAGWVQSLCRAAAHREILFDLQRALREEFDVRGKTTQFDLLSKTYSNLLREFAEL